MSEADLKRRLDSVTAELLATYEELEALTTVAEIAASTADVGVVGRRLLDEASSLLGAEVAFIIYTDPDLKGEEPPPSGISPQERDALRAILATWIETHPKPAVMAPFAEGASVPHAPDALLAVPLRWEGAALGAICLGRRGAGRTFSAGDLKILSVLGSSAGAVLLQRKNLDLVRLTRRLEERTQLLKGILSISREIAASLDLDRLLHALANLPSVALGFDRCAVLLEEGGNRRLRSVSGVARIDRADPEIRSLEKVLEWCAGRGARVLVQEREAGEGEAGLAADPPEAGEQVAPHLHLSGAKSFLAIPLRDDQGGLGVIAFESSHAGFADETKQEGATILANQATVALRNAHLYGDVPFIGLLNPIRRGFAVTRAIPRRKLAVWAGVALAVLGILVLGRWEQRVAGKVTALPSQVVLVSARVRGVIRDVGGHREGDRVAQGAVLARLSVPDLDMRFNEVSSRQESTLRNMARLQAEGKAAELKLASVEAQRWGSETAHLRRLIDDATLRAPLEGILLTPRLAERAGELLEVGSVFCTLADIDPLRVEIAVREIDADVLVGNSGGHEGGVPQREGRPLEAAVKFSAFPESYYRAKIVGVRTAVETLHGERVLVAEGEVTGSPVSLERLRPGMTGDARILCGSRPLISVLLRRPYRFLRSLIWL